MLHSVFFAGSEIWTLTSSHQRGVSTSKPSGIKNRYEFELKWRRRARPVIAPGEHYITPGVAVVSKPHWSQLQFKPELPLQTAGAPCISLCVPPCSKKSVGSQIAEEHTRLILNGYRGHTCLSVLFRGVMRATRVASELWHRPLRNGFRWGLSRIFRFLLCCNTGCVIPLSHERQTHKVEKEKQSKLDSCHSK